MKLSEVLQRYYVVANQCNQFVLYSISDGEEGEPDEIEILWGNDEDMLEYSVVAYDQDIMIDPNLAPGCFRIVDTQNDPTIFMALRGADLSDTPNGVESIK